MKQENLWAKYWLHITLFPLILKAQDKKKKKDSS